MHSALFSRLVHVLPSFSTVSPSSGILLSLVYELHVSLLYALTYVHWIAIAGFL